MNILATQYTLQNYSLDIYVAGCKGNPHCKNCHNPESWDFNQGQQWCEDYWFHVLIKVQTFDKLIKNIMIFGGEPLDQNHNELQEFLRQLKTIGKNIWVFTRYDLIEVPNFVLEYCDYIKCGRYVPELAIESHTQYGITLATSNQHIYKKGLDY